MNLCYMFNVHGLHGFEGLDMKCGCLTGHMRAGLVRENLGVGFAKLL